MFNESYCTEKCSVLYWLQKSGMFSDTLYSLNTRSMQAVGGFLKVFSLACPLEDWPVMGSSLSPLDPLRFDLMNPVKPTGLLLPLDASPVHTRVKPQLNVEPPRSVSSVVKCGCKVCRPQQLATCTETIRLQGTPKSLRWVYFNTCQSTEGKQFSRNNKAIIKLHFWKLFFNLRL